MTQTRSLLNSIMFLSDDTGSIPHAISRGFLVIGLVEDKDLQKYLQSFPNTAIFSSLLPSANSITMFLERNTNAAKGMYYNELGSNTKKEQIVSILTAMYRRTNPILIFTERDANVEFCILEVFHQFMKDAFGIFSGPYPQGPAYNLVSNECNFRISDLLYTTGKINSMEYAMIKPEEAIPSDEACGLLLRDINYGFKPDVSYVNICMQYLKDLKCEKQTGKKSPLIVIKDTMEQKRNDKINELVMNSQTRFG